MARRLGSIRSCRRASAGREVGTPAGPMPALLPPGMPRGVEPRMDPVPALGEHTDAILRRARLRRRRTSPRCARRRRDLNPSMTMNDHPEPDARRLRRRAALRRHPRAGGAPRRGPAARLARLGAGRQGRAAGRGDRALRRGDGAGRRPERGADRPPPQRRPLFAAMVNAAASHFAEQDDVHNGSVFHPAAVVFPAALAVAQALGRCGARAARGRGRGLRGRHPRRRVPRPLALQGLPHHRHRRHAGRRGGGRPPARARRREQMLHAFGSAGTQAAGLWEFLRDAADSKQLHTAHAAAAGLMAAYLARDGFTGATQHPRRRAGHGGGHVERRRSGAPGRPPRRSAGRWPRPRSSSTPRAATRIRPPMRCSQVMQRARPARRATSRASPRMCIRARSTCSGRWSIRRRCTRRSSRWAPCSA